MAGNYLLKDTSSNYVIKYRKSQIPYKIKREIRRVYHSSASMANPNRNFRSSCTASPLLKVRRLIFYAQSKNQSILFVERGYGFYNTRKILLFLYDKGQYKLVINSCAGRNCETLDNVLDKLQKSGGWKNGKTKPEDW